MAVKSMAYDHPQYTVRNNFSLLTAAGNATSSSPFVSFQAVRLHAVSIKVMAAGTSAGSGNALIFRGIGTGTTNFTTVALGTNTAGYTTRVELPSTATMAAFDHLISVNGTDATGRAYWAVEYSAVPGADVTD